MSTTLRLSRSQAEKAIAAYIKSQQAVEGQPALIANCCVEVRKGQLNEDGTFTVPGLEDAPNMPIIAVACPMAKRHEMGLGYVVATVHIIVMGQVDPVPADPTSPVSEGNPLNSPKTDHDQLCGWLAELFTDENNAAAVLALNAPDEGEDTRVVKNFRCFGYIETDDISQETERHWIDDFSYEVHCQPTDDTSL